MSELQDGAGKTEPLLRPDLYEMRRPVVVNGRSIRIYGWPKKDHQWLFDLVTEKNSVPPELCVAYAQTPKDGVFVGMLQGKLVPFICLDVNKEEIEAIAEEFTRRLKKYGA